MSIPVVLLVSDLFMSGNAKVAHGLIRYGERFAVTAVAGEGLEGRDAGELFDGRRRNIPTAPEVAAAVAAAEKAGHPKPQCAVIGVATKGGVLTPPLRRDVLAAIGQDLDVCNGLHHFLVNDDEIAAAAARRGVKLIDVRKPPPVQELRFWTGELRGHPTPRIAFLGMDCAIGKRTAASLTLNELCRRGLRAELIYTGQTGWMQGFSHGIILDSLPNDFVSGELEGAVLRCLEDKAPQAVLLEGQSSLSNPSGPCGSELVLSADARHLVMQYAPGRRHFVGLAGPVPLPPLERELEILDLWGCQLLALSINGEGCREQQLEGEKEQLRRRYQVPVVDPVVDGVSLIADQIQGLTA